MNEENMLPDYVGEVGFGREIARQRGFSDMTREVSQLESWRFVAKSWIWKTLT